MLDLTKYEGHTPKPWTIITQPHFTEGWKFELRGPNNQLVLTMGDGPDGSWADGVTDEDGRLMADAPLLLAEVAELRIEKSGLENLVRILEKKNVNHRKRLAKLERFYTDRKNDAKELRVENERLQAQLKIMERGLNRAAVHTAERDDLQAKLEEFKRALYFSTALLKGFAYGNYTMSSEGTAKSVDAQIKWNGELADTLLTDLDKGEKNGLQTQD